MRHLKNLFSYHKNKTFGSHYPVQARFWTAASKQIDHHIAPLVLSFLWYSKWEVTQHDISTDPQILALRIQINTSETPILKINRISTIRIFTMDDPIQWFVRRKMCTKVPKNLTTNASTIVLVYICRYNNL